MARSGRFGRLPRTAPSLASVIVSLTREMNALMDRNMVTAWEEGGEVDGEQVTDERLIEHFRKRRDQIDQSDPLWDYYDNLLLNYEFTIADSKQTLAYAEGRVNDMGMAAFYTQWASRFPQNSEAWRTAMRTAAQYRDRARQVSQASGARARQQAYQATVNDVYNRYQRDWDISHSIITRAAQRMGILEPDEDLADMRTSGEANREEDFNRFLALFEELGNSTDPEMSALRTELENAGLGGLTYTDFMALAGQNAAGFRALADTALRFDDPDQARDFREDGLEFTYLQTFVEDADQWVTYERVRDQFAAEWSDPSNSPYDLLDIADRYAREYAGILADSASSALGGALNNEILGLRGEAGGTAGVEAGTSAMSDVMETSLGVQNAKSMIEMVESGRAVLSPWTYDGNTREERWSLVDPAVALNPRSGMLVVTIEGGRTVQMWVPFSFIKSRAAGGVNPRSQFVTKPLEPMAGTTEDIGVTYTLPGSGVTMFGAFAPDGTIVWMDHSPFELPPGARGGTDPVIDPLTGDVIIEWSVPEAEANARDFDPFSIFDADIFNPLSELDGRYSGDEAHVGMHDAAAAMRGYYLGTDLGRQALLGASDPLLAQTLAVSGMDELTAATTLLAMQGWRGEARAQMVMEARARGEVYQTPIGERVGGVQKGAGFEGPTEEVAAAHALVTGDRNRQQVRQLFNQFGPTDWGQLQEDALASMSDREVASWLRGAEGVATSRTPTIPSARTIQTPFGEATARGIYRGGNVPVGGEGPGLPPLKGLAPRAVPVPTPQGYYGGRVYIPPPTTIKPPPTISVPKAPPIHPVDLGEDTSLDPVTVPTVSLPKTYQGLVSKKPGMGGATPY